MCIRDRKEDMKIIQIPMKAPEGRPTAEKTVKQWQQKHPEGKKADCIRETGLSKPTVYKWWTWEKETGNIDFTTFTASFWFISKWGFPRLPLFHLFFWSIWFNADSGNLTFLENALCFQGFLCPLLFLLSQIWDKKGNHLRKHNFFAKELYFIIWVPK